MANLVVEEKVSERIKRILYSVSAAFFLGTVIAYACESVVFIILIIFLIVSLLMTAYYVNGDRVRIDVVEHTIRVAKGKRVLFEVNKDEVVKITSGYGGKYSGMLVFYFKNGDTYSLLYDWLDSRQIKDIENIPGL